MESDNFKREQKDVWADFGPWLRRRREIAGKSRKVVAAEIGIHLVQLARIETGESGTRTDTLDALIKCLHLDAKETYIRAGFWPEGAPGLQENLNQDPAMIALQIIAKQKADVVKHFLDLPPEERPDALEMMAKLTGASPEILEALHKVKTIRDDEWKGKDVEEKGSN